MSISVDILVTAWSRHKERLKCFEKCIVSLSKNLIIDRFVPRFVVSSETQYAKFQKEIKEISVKHNFEFFEHKASASLGNNLNFIHSEISGDFILYVQEDFELCRPLNLIEDINFLQQHKEYLIVQYMRYMRDWKIDKRIDDTKYHQLSNTNPYYYSEQPHLKTRSFIDLLGKYSDSLVAENVMNEICRKKGIQTIVKIDEPETFKSAGARPSMLEKHGFIEEQLDDFLTANK